MIQLRDFVHSTRGEYLDMSRVIRTNDASIKERDYLKTGDVLITVKGVNKHAFVLTEVSAKKRYLLSIFLSYAPRIRQEYFPNSLNLFSILKNRNVGLTANVAALIEAP